MWVGVFVCVCVRTELLRMYDDGGGGWMDGRGGDDGIVVGNGF